MDNVGFKKGTTVCSGYEAKDAQVLDGLVQGLLKCITKNKVKAWFMDQYQADDLAGRWQAYNAINISSIEKLEKQLEEFTSEQADRISTPFGRLGDQLQALAKDPAMLALFKQTHEDKLVAAANK